MTYNTTGRRIRTENLADPATVTLSYDAMGRQTRAVDAAGVTTLAYPNGLTASWTYGSRGELLEVDNALPGGTVSKYAYTYDAAGRRIACAKSGSAFATPDTYAYLYNVRSELTNATAEVDAAYRYGYDLDDIGNRKTSAERGVESAEYTANNLNQYTDITSQTSRTSQAFQTSFDADGNQTLVKTATGIWQVTYNGENRPILWTCLESNNPDNSNNQTIVSMTFDRMGRRVTKNDQRFVYKGYLQIANCHSPTLNSNFFIWDPTEPVATRPLTWLSGTPVAYYTHDGNKNVSEVIASDGAIATHYEYAPFGALTVCRGTSAAVNPWRFSSEYAEDDTATVYYNYRHYEPVMGRWLGRDPIPTDALGITCYDFCLQNAISIVDLLGLEESGCNSELISSHSVSILPMIGMDIFSGITDKFNSKVKRKWVELSASFSVNGSVTFENKRCACCMKDGEVVDEKWDGSISGTVTLDVYSHHDSLSVSGLDVSYWFGAKGSITGEISGSIGGSSDRCNGKDLGATLSYSLGVRGAINFGGSFTIKLSRYFSYTTGAYGGFSAGYDFERVYQKRGGGPWRLVKEESSWSGDFHVHVDAGFASYDYTKALFYRCGKEI